MGQGPVGNGIQDLAKKKWHGSGLSDEQAGLLKLRPLTREEVAKLGFLEAGAVQIPYFDLSGKTTDFYRLRYLEKLPGANGVLAKPQRYVQAKGTLNEVYLPPLLAKPWSEIAADPTLDLYITEGEFKSACAAVHGLPCIGLGGVDSWRATKRGIVLLPQLEKIKWANRKVWIVFDSDAALNLNVVRAQRALAKILLERGAFVSLVALPHGPEGQRWGLDDFLVAKGLSAFKKILADTPAFPEADALWGMNEEVLYVRDPGLVIERVSLQRISAGQFVKAAYANRHYLETTIKATGIVTKQRSLAARWIEWEHRAEARSVTYAPGKDEYVDGKLNTWPGWAVAPRRGDIGPYEWLLDFLFKKETTSRRWFEQWLAYPIQYPGTKLYTASVIWGLAKGTGKGLLANTILRIYGRNGGEVNAKVMRGAFNGWAESKQFIFGDEITGGDRRLDSDTIKHMITRETMQINVKYLPEYSMPDLINYMFNSNHPDAFFIEDQERRFFVHEVIGLPAERARYETYDDWMRRKDGPSHLFEHLMRVSLKGFNPREHAPRTRAASVMALLGKSDASMWCVQLKEDPTTMLKTLGEEAAKGCDVFTPSQLLRAFDPEGRTRVQPNGLGRELRRSGFVSANNDLPIRTAVGLQRLIIVRNVESWIGESPAKVAAHFNEFFAPEKRKK